MIQIGLLSDTHGFLDDRVFEHFKDCDEVWHAGDIGTDQVAQSLADFKPFRAVYGNIDGGDLRADFPEEQIFEVGGVKVYMIHIGGYHPKYTTKLKKRLSDVKPGLFVCGHSHILKVIPDKDRGLLHINPGAAGKHGFHKVKTLVRMKIDEGKVENLEVIELGKRS